jgi:Flp pilus assembly pilin Flp
MTGRGRPRVRDDAGAASLEYAGILGVVGLIVAALVLSTTPIGAALKSKICDAVGASCGSVASEDRAKELTTCTVRRDDRTLSFGGNLRIFNAERKDGDRLTVLGDGAASVTLSQSTAAGVGLTGRTIKRGGEDTPFSFDAKIQLAGDVAYLHNVPADWGGEEMARSILDDRASTFDRYGNLVVGPWATSLAEGAGRLADGLGSAWRWIDEQVTGNEESREDRAARERAESLSQADAMLVTLSLQGSAWVSGDAGLVKGTASGTAAVRGVVQIGLNSSAADRAGSNFSGVVDLKGTLEGVVGWPGTARPGERPTADIPPFLSGALVGGATWTYKVDYDAEGNPSKLTMTTETSGQGQGGLKPPGVKLPGGRKVDGKGNASVGSAHVEEITLDLTDPANRAAFDDLFLTSGVGVGEHRAQVSQLRLSEFPDLVNRFARLGDRIAADALVIHYDYDLYGHNVGAGGQRRQDGIDFVIAGISWENSALSRELTGATGYDMRTGGLPFDVVTCGS